MFTDFSADEAQARVLDLRSGVMLTVPREVLGGYAPGLTWTPDGRRLAFLLNHWITEGEIARVDAVELYTIRSRWHGQRKLAVLPPHVMSGCPLSGSAIRRESSHPSPCSTCCAVTRSSVRSSHAAHREWGLRLKLDVS